MTTPFRATLRDDESAEADQARHANRNAQLNNRPSFQPGGIEPILVLREADDREKSHDKAEAKHASQSELLFHDDLASKSQGQRNYRDYSVVN